MKTYLFITDTNYAKGKLTGGHRRLLELIRSVEEDNKVIIVSRSIPQLDDIKDKGNITFHYISDKKLPILPHHISSFLKLACTLRQLRISHYDYAIAFNPMFTLAYRLAGYNRIISLFREDLIGYMKSINASKLKIRYFARVEKEAVKISDKIIVQCQNDYFNLTKRNPECKNKTFIQTNNANASWMQVEEVKHEFIKDEMIRILFVGGFSNPRKGHGILIPAVARLINDGLKIKLLVAGDGAELGYYKELYKEYQDIEFLGRVNINDYLKISDFEIVPSLIDSCPNTVLEGLNAGLAVYGTNSGGIPDLLQHKEFLFEANEDAIYCFLREVIETRRFEKDVILQKKLKDKLTFDWGKSIISIIEK